MKNLHWLHKTLALIVLVVLSLIFLTLGYELNNSFLQSLFTNMAATALYVLVAYFTYDVARKFTKNKETKEIREYAETYSNPVIFSVLYHSLMKLIYKPDEIGHIPFLDQLVKTSKSDLTKRLSDKQFLGFELLKNEDATTNAIRELIENPFLLTAFDNQQHITLIKISNRLERLWDTLSDLNNLDLVPNSRQDKVRILHSKDISSLNGKWPDRRILAEKTKIDNEAIVKSFADFDPKLTDDQLIEMYKIKESALNKVVTDILDIFQLLDSWIRHSENGLVVRVR